MTGFRASKSFLTSAQYHIGEELEAFPSRTYKVRFSMDWITSYWPSIQNQINLWTFPATLLCVYSRINAQQLLLGPSPCTWRYNGSQMLFLFCIFPNFTLSRSQPWWSTPTSSSAPPQTGSKQSISCQESSKDIGLPFHFSGLMWRSSS